MDTAEFSNTTEPLYSCQSGQIGNCLSNHVDRVCDPVFDQVLSFMKEFRGGDLSYDIFLEFTPDLKDVTKIKIKSSLFNPYDIGTDEAYLYAEFSRGEDGFEKEVYGVLENPGGMDEEWGPSEAYFDVIFYHNTGQMSFYQNH